MKKLVTAAMIVLCLNATAQIQVQHPEPIVTVGKCKNGMYTQAELSYRVSDKDTLYSFTFLNAKYETLNDYQTVVFSGEGNTINDFYNVLMSFFSDEHKKDKTYKVDFKLGDQQVTASNIRSLGVTSVMFYTPKGYVFLTEKQINRVFGKG